MRCFHLIAIGILLALSGAGTAGAATSNRVVTPRATVSVVSATEAPQGRTVRLGLLFDLKPDWHIYWSDPGDAGQPPSVSIASPAGAKAGALSFPPPRWLVAGGVGDYIASGKVLLPFDVTLPKEDVKEITARANWLVCNPKMCVPEHGEFHLTLSGGAGASPQAALFAKAAADAPRPSPYRATIAPDGTLAVTGTGLGREAVRSAHFYPDQATVIANAAKQKLGFVKDGFTLKLTPQKAGKTLTAISGVLEITDPSGRMQALTMRAGPGAAPAPLGGVPWIAWIGAAVLGGLILNLMPCVFPVLAMKAMALVRLGRDDRKLARREAVAYAAGTVVAMLGLGGGLMALRAAGLALGWGFQFQSPVFIAVMTWLVFAIGLNFAGVFDVSGLENLGAGLARHGGVLGSFATGLLAVAVATPCTAPFMGGALAAALAAPLMLGLTVFGALGFGIGLPFVVLAILPAVARILPRPGAWMDVLRQVLAFPMFATALWLLWVMSVEAGSSGVLIVGAGALLIGFAAWLLRFHGILWRGIAVAAVVGAVLLLPRVTPAGADGGSALHGAVPASAVAYSPAKLAGLRSAGRAVFVDMSAAWCITCQVNERIALAPASMQRFFADHHVTLMVGDWTRRDPAITRFLAAHGRDGVPIYVYYPPDHGAAKVLPQVLTPDIVRAAIAGG